MRIPCFTKDYDVKIPQETGIPGVFNLKARQTVTIEPNQSEHYSTGLVIQMPKGHVLLVQEHAYLKNLNVTVQPFFIAHGFVQELIVKITNNSDKLFFTVPAEMLLTMVILLTPSASNNEFYVEGVR